MEDSSAARPRRKHKTYKNHPAEPRAQIATSAPISLIEDLDAYCEVHATDRAKALRAAITLLLATATTP